MKFMKKFSAILLALSMIFSTAVFAEDAGDAESSEKSEAMVLMEALARNLEIYARYPEVDEGTLFAGAIDAILKENPELLDTALSGMLSSIDENSVYYTPDEADELFESLWDEIGKDRQGPYKGQGNLFHPKHRQQSDPPVLPWKNHQFPCG